MISYIEGMLENIGDKYIVIETGGIGFKVLTTDSTISNLSNIGTTVKIYTYMSVKDDGISLFGFYSRDELDIFNKLITVNGLGPKGALGIMSAFKPVEIIMSIVSDDVNTLCKAPGVGKKTAQRIILDLKDKFKNDGFIDRSSDISELADNQMVNGPQMEATEALTSLGYSRHEAAKAVNNVYKDGMTTGDTLKLALHKLSRI